MFLPAPQLHHLWLTWVVKVAEGYYLMAFVDATAEVVDGILPSRDKGQDFIVVLHSKQQQIVMDSDEQPSTELYPYSKFLFQHSEHISKEKKQILIAIFGRESRGSGLKKHTDKLGKFQVWRRFNQFNQMRLSLVRAWPGCLIPSLPSKNPLTKNEEEISKKRERYLNDFLKKTALRSFLYYSDEFQALLRSVQSNLSETFDRWPAPTVQNIIIRYKQTFPSLAGRTVHNGNIEEIFDFHRWLEENQKTLIGYRRMTKEMAFQRDRLNKYYLQFFRNMKLYEEAIVSTYTSEDNLIYANPQFKSCQQHQTLITKYVEANSYWMFYDLIKNEERDGRAFVQLIDSIEHYAEKAKDVQEKIETNVKGISETTAGRNTIKTIGMRGTADEIKFQLEVQNESLKKDKQLSEKMRDIIVALVCFIEIPEYKASKKMFYEYTLRKWTAFEDVFSSKAAKIWEELQTGIEQLVEKT